MRLIDADALKESLKQSKEACNTWYDNCDSDMKPRVEQALITFMECIIRVNNMPTVEERKKGKWIAKTDIVSYWACSECLAVAMRDDYGQQVLTDYCSCCGARMEKQ